MDVGDDPAAIAALTGQASRPVTVEPKHRRRCHDESAFETLLHRGEITAFLLDPLGVNLSSSSVLIAVVTRTSPRDLPSVALLQAA